MNRPHLLLLALWALAISAQVSANSEPLGCASKLRTIHRNWCRPWPWTTCKATCRSRNGCVSCGELRELRREVSLHARVAKGSGRRLSTAIHTNVPSSFSVSITSLSLLLSHLSSSLSLLEHFNLFFILNFSAGEFKECCTVRKSMRRKLPGDCDYHCEKM